MCRQYNYPYEKSREKILHLIRDFRRKPHLQMNIWGLGELTLTMSAQLISDQIEIQTHMHLILVSKVLSIPLYRCIVNHGA